MLNDDLSYKSHFGDPGVSLLAGAQEAIKNVLSDSATLQQANFGVMFWNTTMVITMVLQEDQMEILITLNHL